MGRVGQEIGMTGMDRALGGRSVPKAARRGAAASTDQEEGFTLLELLVVIAILAMLIGLVAPAALRQLGGARVSVARQSIERLGGVLDLYKLDMGAYPTSEQGLQALLIRPSGATTWSGPYVNGTQVPVDPWNRAYVYRSPASRSGHEYDLCSRGPDGQANDSNLICNP